MESGKGAAAGTDAGGRCAPHRRQGWVLKTGEGRESALAHGRLVPTPEEPGHIMTFTTG